METRAAATMSAQNRILEAALDELVAVGGESITMQAVADRADLALRTLYNHFPNRDALLTAAYLYHAAQTRTAVEAAVTVPDAGPEDQLRYIIEAYYSAYARMGPRLTALLSLSGIPELDEQVGAIRAWRRQLLGKIIQRARRAGVLAMPVPAAVALAFTITSHAAWQILLEELDGAATNPPRVAGDALSAALFNR